MADSSSWGVLAPYKTAPLPPLTSMFKALGPGVIFMALAQGSGELIWWPYIIAKYGLSFLFLLLPACLLQFPVTYEIGRYTVLTGESIFQGFIRLQRHFAFFLWILMTFSIPKVSGAKATGWRTTWAGSRDRSLAKPTPSRVPVLSQEKMRGSLMCAA